MKTGIYIMPAGGGASLPLSVTPGTHNEAPCWVPGGSLSFTSSRKGNFDIWIMDTDIEMIREKLREQVE